VLAHFFQALTSRFAGPVGFAVALLVTGLLVATSISAVRTEARLRARIAEVTRESQQAGVVWHARLSACQNEAVALQAASASAGGKPIDTSAKARARRLAANEPPGFDVCARMESADRAVLESLK